MDDEFTAAPDWAALIKDDQNQRIRMAKTALDYAATYVNADEAAYARKIAEQTGVTYEEALRNPKEATLLRHRQMFGSFSAAHGTGDMEQIPRRARARADLYNDLNSIERFIGRPLLKEEKRMFLGHAIRNEADRAEYINALPDDEPIPPKPNKAEAKAEHRLADMFRAQSDKPHADWPPPFSGNMRSPGQTLLGQGHLRGLAPEERSLALVNVLQALFSGIGLVPYFGSLAQALAYAADGQFANAGVNAFSLGAGALPKKIQDKGLPSLFKGVDMVSDLRGLGYSLVGADAGVLPKWLVPQPQQGNDGQD